ncbi:MAG TPA: hypothetical protein VFU16_01100 [Solirubrobacterales bacterium]|nr:hypothetical protein [Solirubrobacterales bacterium]
MLEEPLEREAPLPLLELRGLLLDLIFDFALALTAFGFDDDLDLVAGFADFEVDDFDLGFGFDFGVDLVLV